jgi:hypothetical protein
MPARVARATLLSRLSGLLEGRLGFARVNPDAADPVARAAVEALAGLPGYDLAFAGYQRGVALVACLSGDRLPGVELERRAELLFGRTRVLSERLDARVAALQLAVYERPVPAKEREHVLSRARRLPFLGFGKARVSTWLFALDEPALHAAPYPGWPPELSVEELRQLLLSSAA